MPALPRSTMTHLECSHCGKTHPHNCLQNLCTCGKPLLARYELKAAAKTLTREALTARPVNMWRYAEVLPGGPPVSLGEGMTPLRSEEHTSELQSRPHLVCRLLLEKKKKSYAGVARQV